eukprot:727602-Amphidinium_carterae.1
MGLLEAVETHTVSVQVANAEASDTYEEATVAILYFGPEFLRDRLAESMPAGNGELHTFAASGPGGLPLVAEVIDSLDFPADFTTGTMLKTVLLDDGSTTTHIVHL